MLVLLLPALAGEPPLPPGTDTRPLVWPRPVAAPAPTTWRFQQEVVPARSMGLVLLQQADLHVSAAPPDRKGDRTWTAVAVRSTVEAWTDFGNVADADLAKAAKAPAESRWIEHRDGRIEPLADGDNAAQALLAAVGNLGDQLRVPAPAGPVPPGGSWSRHQETDLDVPMDDARLAVHLVVDRTWTFRGWATLDGATVAFLESTVEVRGLGAVTAAERVTPVALSARMGGWSWIDPDTGELVYGLAQGEVAQEAGRFDWDEQGRVSTLRLSLSRLPEPPPPAPPPG